MVKLYSRQGVTLKNAAGIREPETVKNPFIGILDKTAKITADISKKNYALGRAQLITDVLETAYEAAPDNPEQFNSLVKSGFEKSMAGLSDTTRQEVYKAADDKVKALQIKVGNNLNARLDRENTELVLSRADNLINGQNGVLAMNKAIMAGILAGADRNEIDQYINIQNQNKAHLEALAKAKNLKGNYIINSKDIRNAIATGEYNMNDVINEGLRELDYEALKEFDEKTFQDRKRFQEKTGITDKTYDQISKNIKNMRKDLNAEDQRQIKAQRDFNVVQYITSRNPEYLEQSKDAILQMKDGKKLYKQLESLMKGKGEVNPALVTDEDANFIENFNAITTIINSTNDGSPDYDEKLTAQLVQAAESLDEYRYKYGASDETVDAINEILINSASDQMYANAMQIAQNSKLQQVTDAMNVKKATQREEYTKAYEKYLQVPLLGSLAYSAAGLRAASLYPAIEQKPSIDSAKSVAASTIKQMLNYARLLRQPNLSQETKETIVEGVKEIQRRGNIEIIKYMSERFLPKETWDRLEAEFAQGKPAEFEYLNGHYMFKGFSENDIIVEEKD